MKILLIAAGIVLLLYCAFLFLARFYAHWIIFPAPQPTYAKTDDTVFIKMPDGAEIAGVYMPAKNSQYCIIYNHGNGEDIGMISELLRGFQARGISVFVYDYIGYGLSKGAPREQKLYQAADVVWDYVRNTLGYAETDIVVLGYSLGSAPATHLAAKHGDIRALVIVGGFSKGIYAILPWNIIPWKLLDNASRLADVKAPVLLLHGMRDGIVHSRNADMNFEILKGPSRLFKFDNRGHLDLPESEDYWTEIFNFINTRTNEKSTGNSVR